ncbi:hypothetical protein ACTA71_000091 [Dictyostelium dimigraforme]
MLPKKRNDPINPDLLTAYCEITSKQSLENEYDLFKGNPDYKKQLSIIFDNYNGFINQEDSDFKRSIVSLEVIESNNLQSEILCDNQSNPLPKIPLSPSPFPVHLLLKNNCDKMVKLCLLYINQKNIYDYSIKDSETHTVFDYSIERGDVNIIKLVLLGGGELQVNYRTPKFSSNFKVHKDWIYRILELRKTLNGLQLSRFVPTLTLLECNGVKVWENLEQYIRCFIYKKDSTELKSWKVLIEEDEKLDWSYLLNKYPTPLDNQVEQQLHRLGGNISSVNRINSSRGFVDRAHCIGSGGNSAVYEGSFNGKKIAAVGIVDQFNGDAVVKTYGVLFDSHSTYLVMEKAESNLSSKLSNPTEIHKMLKLGIWKCIFKFINDILSDMKCIQSVGMFHRDLKSANLLIRTGDNKVVVSDFGTGRDPKNGESTLKHKVGTCGYLDPLLGSEQKFDESSDIFSLGIIFWELIVVAMTGVYQRPKSFLFYNDYDICIIRKGVFSLEFPEGTPSSLKLLINQMCLIEKVQRPKLDQVCLGFANIENEFKRNISLIGSNGDSSADEIWREFKLKTIPIKSINGEVYNLTYQSAITSRIANNNRFIPSFTEPSKIISKTFVQFYLEKLFGEINCEISYSDSDLFGFFMDVMHVLKNINPYYKIHFGNSGKIFIFKQKKYEKSQEFDPLKDQY